MKTAGRANDYNPHVHLLVTSGSINQSGHVLAGCRRSHQLAVLVHHRALSQSLEYLLQQVGNGMQRCGDYKQSYEYDNKAQ